MNRVLSTEDHAHGPANSAEDAMVPNSDDRPGLSVLHVYAGNLYGGIETLLAVFARISHLEPSMRMEYALCFPGRLRDEIKAAGGIVHDLGPVKFRHPWTIVRARHRLASLLKRRRFDVVVTHACWPHALLAPVVRRAQRSLVFWQHDFVGSGHWIDRLAARTKPDRVISNSMASAATLPMLFPGVATEIIHSPVMASLSTADAAKTRARIRREQATPDDSVVIIQVCRMERWKGHTLLLESLGRLSDRDDWVAWIVGGAQRPHEQAYLAELVAQATTLGIADRIRFLGQRNDVPCLLASADIHCQPNTGPEPLGLAFIEALNAGLPVVTTRMGGAIEIVTEECGILVDPGSTTALAEALLRLIANPSERARLGAAGPARAADLSAPDRVMSRVAGLASGLAQANRLKLTSSR